MLRTKEGNIQHYTLVKERPRPPKGEGVKIHMDNFRFPSGTNLDAFLYVLLVFVGQIHMGIFHMDNFICIPKIYLGHIQSDFFIWTNSYATFLCLNLS